MSTPDTGDAKLVGDVVADAKAQLSAEAAAAEQLDMLEPVSPEDMIEARDELGPLVGRLTVLRHAREKRRGRPLGARNRRTDDFARYILSFGQHPAITMMQIQGSPPELLIENSRRTVKKLVKGGKDKPDQVVAFDEEMSYEAAQGLRMRAAEGLLPFIESKKVAVDATLRSDFTLIEEIVGEGARAAGVLDGEFLEIQADPPAVRHS